jgi:hypothetical protein
MNSGQARLKDNRAKGVVYTLEERAAHRAAAEQLLATPLGTADNVVKTLRKELGIGPKRAKRVVEQVLDEWSAQQDPKRVSKNRARGAARIRRLIHGATYKRVGSRWVERRSPDLNAIARLEHLLMRYEGTDQPVKVDVNLRTNEAVVGSVMRLTSAQVEAILAEGAELQRLADLARRRLPECVDVEGETIE